MKKRFQKLTSLALVLVMVLTMIPVGGFIATAEVSADLAAGLAAYDTTTEFVINNTDDWNAIAETNQKFSGKTVKLGADIDAEGATLPALFKVHNANPTFDGQNFTIKNIGTSETPNAGGIFNTRLSGTSIGFQGTIQNVTVENCHVSGAGAKGVLVDWVNADQDTSFKNVKVLGCSATSTDAAAGIIVAHGAANGGMSTTFEGIYIANSSASGVSNGGGWNSTGVSALMGYATWNASDSLTAKNIEVINSTFTDTAAASCVAGLFGYIRMNTSVALTIENVYMNAKFVTPNSGGWTGVAAGLFQTANSTTANVITLKNCITNNQYPGIVQYPTLFYATTATFVWENLYSVQQHNPIKAGWLINSGNTVNGTPGLASNYNGIPAEVIAGAAIPFMVTYDANGFISKIAGLAEDNTVFPDYDTTTEFVVNNIEDWEKIASSHKTFSGKTIKLGADIDAEGAPLSFLIFTLNPTSVTFDGQGHTIKNVGTEDAPIMNALIAYSLGGATVKNVTFENIYMTSKTEAALVAIALESQDGMTTTVERVKIKNSHVVSEGSNAGALVAKVSDKGTNGAINFTKINVDASTTVRGNAATGGIIGTANHQKPLHLIGIETSATVTGTSTKVPTDTDPNYDQSVGGLVGYAYANGSEINIESCAVNGSLKGIKIDANGQESKSTVISMAGLIGFVEGPFPATLNLFGEVIDGKNTTQNKELGGFNGPVRTLNIRGAVINCTFSTSARYRTLIVNLKAIGYLNYENVYAAKPTPMWQIVAINNANFINGKHTYGEMSMANPLGRDDIIDVVPYIANRMKVLDSDGFLVKLNSIVEPYGIQYSEVSGGKYAIRFLGTAQLIDERTVMVNVKATTAGGAVKEFTIQSPLFDRVTPFEKHNIDEQLVAADLGAEKLLCVTIYDIPVGEAIDFELSFNVLTKQEREVVSTQTMTFSFDANGALVTAG